MHRPPLNAGVREVDMRSNMLSPETVETFTKTFGRLPDCGPMVEMRHDQRLFIHTHDTFSAQLEARLREIRAFYWW